MADDTVTATPAPAGSPKPETNEIASIAREINIQVFGGVLINTDPTLMTRGGARGLALYDEIKRDCHAGAVLDKRKLAVLSREWDVEPASESRIDRKAAALVKSALLGVEFDHICGNLLEAVLKGYAVAEVMWDVKDGEVVPRDIIARGAHRFAMSVDGQPRLRTPEALLTGIELPERKFIVQRFGASDDFPYGLGLGNALFWPVMFKRQDLTFWLKFVDKFGAPTAVGKYQAGASKQDQDKLLAALNAISNDAGIIVPDGMLVELLNIAATTDSYEQLARYLDEQISERVLGETMTTTSGGAGLGSNQASVHDEVRIEIAQADAKMLDATLTSTVSRWICEFNLPGAGVPRIRRNFKEADDLNQTAARDQILWNIGWERDDASVTATYGPGYVRRPTIDPAAIAGDAVPAGGGAATAGNPGSATFSERGTDALGNPNQEAQQRIADAATSAASEWQRLVGPKVKRIQAVLAETGDLVAFREALSKLVDEAPDPELVERLARGSFAAHVLGRGQEKKPATKSGLFSRLFNRPTNRP